jgi:hypothetical protein
MLKARIVKPAGTAVARELLCKHTRCQTMAATDTHATIEERLEAVFSERSMPRSQDSVIHVEASSNNFTLALEFVGGDEKGTQCLRVSLGHPVSGGCKYGNLALQVGGISNLRQ